MPLKNIKEKNRCLLLIHKKNYTLFWTMQNKSFLVTSISVRLNFAVDFY